MTRAGLTRREAARCCAGVLLSAFVGLSVFVGARATHALELDEVFPPTASSSARASAEAVVAAAFSNLFDFDGVARIESTKTSADGATEISRFQIYRKRIEPGTERLLIATTDPDDPEQQIRMLEVIEEAELRRVRLFAPRVGPEPIPTSYRITDPFLGSFSNRAARDVRSDLSSLVRGYEIVGRESARLDGNEVDRITLRPRAARNLERAELWIARDAPPLILEYRYFEAQSTTPARIARVPRDQMQSFRGRLLPGLMVYDDRIGQTKTVLRLRYEPLPADLGDSPFMESTFHRTRLPD